MRIRSVTLCSCALSLLVLAGCTGGGVPAGPDPVPVEGTVTLDGEPLAGASVMFGGEAFGETDANGRYVLSKGDKKGVPPGGYSVVIEKWLTPDGAPYRSAEGISPMDAGATQELPPRYSNPELTELKATVPDGGGKIDFELKSD